MELSDFKVSELRDAARQAVPESRGVGGLAHVGSKAELVALLQSKGIMPGEVSEILAGNKNVKAPLDPVAVITASITGGTPSDPDTSSTNNVTGGTVAVTVNLGDGEQQKLPLEPKPYNAPSPNQAPSALEQLEIIRQIINGGVKPEPKPAIDEQAVGAIIDSKLNEFRKKMVKTIQVKKPDGTVKPVGTSHYMTERIAQVANLGLHQMLVGPAGGGKTTCAETVAKMLDLQFYPMSVGPQTTKSDLLGFIDAGGAYHRTPLRNAFENGGLLLLDEVDAANAGVLTVINSMLANGYCSFPDGVIQKHDDFRCICACNTYGRGADRQYVGRNQLDAATLDRFVVVDFDYDEALEFAIAGNDDWVKLVQAWRKKAFELKMRVVISPRASIFGARLLSAGIPQKEVEELVVWKGIADDMKQKIRNATH